jgi:lactate racemase
MRIRMNYGRKGLFLDLPDDLEATIIQRKKMPIIRDPDKALGEALSHPVGCKALMEEAKACENACILICDITRPVPNALILPVLIRELIRAGMGPESITVLVATGLHPPNEGEELRELVGNDWVLKTVRVANHFARNEADHVYVGTTSRGMPVKLDRRFVEAELRIIVGLVEPHFMAGYSGGRKVIVPGIAHEDTIRVLHTTRMLTQEGIANCRLEGNPLHGELLQAAEMAGEALAINTVIDEERKLSFINFGRLEASHKAAVFFARPFLQIPIGRKFKTVITSASGYPLDRTYYQTIKAMVAVADILEPDGDIFVVSECSGGLGTGDYAEAQARLIEMGLEAFMAESSLKPFASIDEWQTIMQVKAMKTGRIHLFSECLTEAEWALTGVTVIDALMEAVQQCLAKKQDKQVAVIPEGSYVIPLCRTDHQARDDL